MNADLLPEPAFRKLEWLLVAATAAVIISALAWRAFGARLQPGPIRLLHADYDGALTGARFVVGDGSQRFCVVEFFDYECPPCRLVTPKVRAVALANRGRVSLALQNYPLNMHPHARQLALIACALDRYDFERFDPEAISLNGKQLDVLLDSWHKRLSKVRPAWLAGARGRLESERQAGVRLTVDSTPSLFVFDRLKGATYSCPTVKDLESVISGA